MNETQTTPEKAEKASEAKKPTAKVKKKKSGQKRANVAAGNAYIQASYNNTIITITDLEGKVLAWSSAGSSGFKGTRKSTPYAAQVAAENAANKAKTFGVEKVDIFVKGIGSGREQSIRGLHNAGLKIEKIADKTGIPHNGCRAKKARRV